MDKEQILGKTAEILRPLESANLLHNVQNLTLHQIATHPLIVLAVIIFFVTGIIRKSRTILFFLFAAMVLIILLRFAMPAPGEELTAMGTLPFFGGAILVGGVLLYYTFIKSE